MVKTEISKKTEIKGNGTLRAITGEGFVIHDSKTDEEEIIPMEQLKFFVGKEINLSFKLVEKQEVMVEKNEE